VRKGLPAALAAASMLLLATDVAQAAPPANDSFASASPISVGQEISSTNLDATGEPGEPNNGEVSKTGACAAITDGPDCTTSVWYLFEPPEVGDYVVETCDMGTDVDTVVGVYTGATVSTAEKVTSNDDGAGGECHGSYGNFGSQVQFKAGPGAPHHIAVTGFAGDEGSFYIRLYPGEPQPRPQPDTRIVRGASLTGAEVFGVSGVTSGPRHSASFPLESDAPGATFECSLDGAAFAACQTPLSLLGLTPGASHVFQARAVLGGAIDPTPAIERFTLDSTDPETSLTSGPSGSIATQEATWVAAAGERINSGLFLCRLDGQPPTTPCGSVREFTEFCKGHHVFSIAAIDRASNVDPSPAGAEVDVTVGPSCASPTLGPPEVALAFPTLAVVKIPFDDKGAAGTIHLEYGTTAAYGMEVADSAVSPGAPGVTTPALRYLTPGTEYHYRVTITTPFGSADTGDQTVTAKPLEGTLPAIQNSGPPTAGYFAASLPLTIDPAGDSTSYSALIARGKPVTVASPSVFAPIQVPSTGSGPQSRTIQVADLEPGTTYNYRFAAHHTGAVDTNEVLGPEGSFTTPALPLVSPTLVSRTKPRFRLRKRQVGIGKLTRRSKILIVTVKGLPARTKVKLKLTVGKSKQSARKKAKANGRVRFKLRLSKRIRKALRDKTVKKFKLKVTAKPPGEPASSVTFKKALER
jgi:hypothetical protein